MNTNIILVISAHVIIYFTKTDNKAVFSFVSKLKKSIPVKLTYLPPPQTCWEHCLPNRQKKKKMRKNIRKRGMLIFLHPRSVRAKKNSQDP